MNQFRVHSLSPPENSIWRLYKSRDRIEFDPDYQRLSEIWTKNKKQLLIDTILNGFDVPKFYFHRLHDTHDAAGNPLDYAIIDGKQRLEAIFNFIDGKFALADEFEYFPDNDVNAGGMTYAELAKNYPDLKTDFDSYTLSVVSIEASDSEIIEDLFSRLNEAVPLSAAEKRNAFGGPVPKAIRKLCEHQFFTQKLPFTNTRYRHFNLAAMFFINVNEGEVVDTKKVYLDEWVIEWKESTKDFAPIEKETQKTLNSFSKIFEAKDKLLRQVSMIMVYFHAYRIALRDNWSDKFERSKLVKFDQKRSQNRKIAAEDIAKAEYDLLEFDRFSQSPNDAYAVAFRVSVFLQHAFGIKAKVDDL